MSDLREQIAEAISKRIELATIPLARHAACDIMEIPYFQEVIEKAEKGSNNRIKNLTKRFVYGGIETMSEGMNLLLKGGWVLACCVCLILAMIDMVSKQPYGIDLIFCMLFYIAYKLED